MVDRVKKSGKGKEQKKKAGPRASSENGFSKIKVSIMHGNLGYTRHAVAVGHYLGDSIVGAEAYLDRVFNHRLSDRRDMGQYPGKLETNAVFLNPAPDAKPGGAIIVGLGPVGKLNSVELASSFAAALAAYVLAVSECREDQSAARGEERSVRVTSLLIGTGAGGISVEESVFAILKGAKNVAALLREKSEPGKKNIGVRIDELEFVELWQDAALKAARALEKVKRHPEFQGVFDCDVHLRESTGGQRRLHRDEDPEWWHRLQILSDEKGGLRFNAVTGRARTEVSLLATQRTALDGFLEQSVTNCSNDRETARTLFELLMPNLLKEQAPDRRKTVLLLDSESARYPWELLEDRYGGSGRPAAVESGLVRQLETEQFRERVNTTGENSIFVVGNPVTRFTPLPGAAAEARLVAKVFAGRGFHVAKQIESDALSIIKTLHARAYRVLHLAGHGVHEEAFDNVRKTAAGPGEPFLPDEKPAIISGMIIGDDIFLTPADVEQMRSVPELVFINCCYLGRTDKTGKSPVRKDSNKLAANVAAQFIRMGVRAVVAAGWAVDDDAAATFAREFYKAMLAGEPFGEAVRKSREKTYTRHRQVNTWGAYQCYGDPDYRLIVNRQARHLDAEDRPYVAAAEMLVDIENLIGRAQSAQDADKQTFRTEIDRMIEKGEPSWLHQADVACALGLACGAVGDFPEAVGYLDAALKANDAQVTLRAVEQRSNFKIRWAASPDRTGRKVRSGVQAASMIAEAIRDLELLNSLTSTPERLSLLGGGYKRLASLSGGDERRKALASMAARYKDAHSLAYAEGKGAIDSYSLLNWLAAEVLIELYSPEGGVPISKKLVSQVDTWCALARDAAAKKDKTSPDFWNSVAIPDADLLCAVSHGNLAQTMESIFEGYRTAGRRGASIRQFRSVTEHLAFLAGMIAEAPQKRSLQKDLKALRQLAVRLNRER